MKGLISEYQEFGNRNDGYQCRKTRSAGFRPMRVKPKTVETIFSWYHNILLAPVALLVSASWDKLRKLIVPSVYLHSTQELTPVVGNGDLQSHRCRSWQIFGDAKEFCPNSPNLPEKIKQKSPPKKCQFGRHFFQIKACWKPFLLKFSGVCEVSQRFFPNFVGFCPNFRGFCPDFNQIGTFDGAVAPPAPPLPTLVYRIDPISMVKKSCVTENVF